MLSQLTDIKMKAAGIDDKDLRKFTLAAFRKAGYTTGKAAGNRNPSNREGPASRQSNPEAGPSAAPSTVQVIVSQFIIVVFDFS